MLTAGNSILPQGIRLNIFRMPGKWDNFLQPSVEQTRSEFGWPQLP
jgi:hypothetical protein